MTSQPPQDDVPRIAPPPLPKRGSSAPPGPPLADEVEAADADSGDHSEPIPPPVVAPPPLASDARAGEYRCEQFLEKARFILAGERGITPKSQAMLEAAARELGLSDEEFEDAMGRLHRGTTGECAPSMPGATPPPSPPEPEAPPCAAKPRESPSDIFRRYVSEALARSPRDYLSERRERKLVAEGVRKLGLSEVLARQLVRQVARAAGRRVVSLERETNRREGPGDLAQHPGVAEFLDRATAILAEQRGINARSRVLLAAAASELGLSHEEADQAIARLQGKPVDESEEEVWHRERVEAFRQYLDAAMAPLAHKVATSCTEHQWIEDGCLHHGVDPEEARRMVREAMAAHDVRVVSEEQAKEHVAALVEQLMGERVRLDLPTRAKIFSEGSQWGLAPMQVDAILREHVRKKRRKLASERGLARLLTASAVIATVGLAAFLGWVFFFKPPAAAHLEQLAREQPAEAVLPPPPAPAIESPTGREWWAQDEDLLIAVTKTRIVLPRMKPVLAALALQDPEARGRAYHELVSVAGANADNEVHRAILRELVARCYAADPSDQAAGALREALLALTPAVGDSLPQDAAAYEIAFWAVRTAATALGCPSLAPARADDLARALSRSIGATIDRTRTGRELERQCLAALCRHLYQVIIAAAGSQPLVAGPLYMAVTRKAVDYLEAHALETRHVAFLCKVLPQVGDAWHEYEYLIQRTINSTDPLIVLELVDLYEDVTDASLRDFLADRLLRRAGIFPQSLSVDEVARRVREALGAKEIATGQQRWKELLQWSKGVLGEADAGIADRQQLLEQTLRFAYGATRACALAQGEVGYPTYDQLREEGPPRLATLAASAARRARYRAGRSSSATVATARHRVESFIRQLTIAGNGPSYRRVYLRGIASFAPDVPDLDHKPAETLARYLLKPKSDEEHQIVLEFAQAVTRWRAVRLALADLVLETPVYKERVEQLMARVVAQPPKLDKKRWKRQVHDALLGDVIAELAAAPVRTGGAGQIYDEACDALRDFYRTQARLMGISPDRYEAAETPAHLLHVIIEDAAAKLTDGGSSPEARRFLAELPHRFTAIGYFAENDLQRAVLLQRLWLRVLALRIARTHADRAGEAQRLVERLVAESGDPKSDAFGQLRDAEKALFEMWLLARES